MATNTKNNMDIREALAAKKMTQWQLAILLGISEPTLTRWMRQELPEERKKEILNQIENGGK